jgi:hypothetical protein
LAKLYHVEAGSEYVHRILADPACRLLISRLSVVEMESVFAIKTRTGEIGQQDVEIARRCLRSDLTQQRLLVAPPIRTDHLQTARALLVSHGAAEGLRTLDALQLAIALDLRLGARRLHCCVRPEAVSGRYTIGLPCGEPGETRTIDRLTAVSGSGWRHKPMQAIFLMDEPGETLHIGE